MIDPPDAWFLHAAPVSAVCAAATVDVTTEVVPELKVDVDVPIVGVKLTGVDVGVSETDSAVGDALLVGTDNGTEEDVDGAGADEDELSLMIVNSGLALPESPNT